MPDNNPEKQRYHLHRGRVGGGAESAPEFTQIKLVCTKVKSKICQSFCYLLVKQIIYGNPTLLPSGRKGVRIQLRKTLRSG